MTDALLAEALVVAKSLRQLNRTIPVRGIRESIPLPDRTLDAVYYPATEKGAPVIFAFHGGGFLFGGCALDDGLWHATRETLRANVISIDYRMGEENLFPAPLYDAYDAIKYYLEDKRHDFDRGRIAVMGNSAGANESATVSILAKRRGEYSIGLQILVYPFVDMVTPPQEKRIDPTQLSLYRYFNDAHARREDWADPLASPLYASREELTGLARAVVVLAEDDGLFDEGAEYADKLQEAGVQVDRMVAQGMPHGFLEFAYLGTADDFCPPAIKAAAANGTLALQAARTMEFIKSTFEDWARR